MKRRTEYLGKDGNTGTGFPLRLETSHVRVCTREKSHMRRKWRYSYCQIWNGGWTAPVVGRPFRSLMGSNNHIICSQDICCRPGGEYRRPLHGQLRERPWSWVTDCLSGCVVICLQASSILFHLDNVSAGAFLDKMGGTHSSIQNKGALKETCMFMQNIFLLP